MALKGLEEGSITVLIIPNNKYTDNLNEVSARFSKDYKACVYVSLNTIYSSLDKRLKSKKIATGKFFFVDGMTKSIDPRSEESRNCVYISSPSALTELSIALGKLIDSRSFDSIIFDSLSTLLVYNKSDPVGKFVHSLVNKIKSAGMTAVFTALEGDAKSDLIKEISMYVDNIYDA